MISQKFKTINEMADAVITEILKPRENPFDTITLVFHNTKVAQWFKAYFLKKQSDILMNVEFKTIAAFINEAINPDEKYRILTASEYREFVIKALLENEIQFDEKNYYTKPDGEIDGINLYEFADKLSTIFFNMEFDNEEIEKDWQKVIYKYANEYAELKKCFTPKNLAAKAKTSGFNCKNAIIFDNSFLTKQYQDILNTLPGNLKLYSLSGDNETTCQNLSLVSAPSMLREVENLHSEICRIIQDNKDVRVNDIVVYAPNINDYANTIHRVFQKNYPGFPDIPFRIAGECQEKQNMISSLNLLFRLANKAYFTRNDFVKFVNNAMIMAINDITSEDVEAFTKTIVETHTHRNGDENNDWEYLKKRLLLSMLVGNSEDIENKAELSGNYYLPYSSMDMDEIRINKMISIIDQLTNWCNFFADDKITKTLSKDDISTINQLYADIYSRVNSFNEEKNYLYSDVKAEIDKIDLLFDEIPTQTFLLFVNDAPSKFSSIPGDIFAGGVTFLSLVIDNIIFEPYTFVLGMSSGQFPRVETRNEIDYSSRHRYTQDLDKDSIKNLLSNSDTITFSYICQDLQSGEEFYPSSTIPQGINQVNIPLDENREIDTLFTMQALISRERIENLGQNYIQTQHPALPTNDDTPVFSTSKFNSFINNSIVYKYSQIFKSIEDENEIKTDEYEVIDVDSLTKYNIVKDMIIQSNLNNEKRALCHELPCTRFSQELNKSYVDYYDTIIVQQINEIINKDGFVIMKPFSVQMKTPSGKPWILEMNHCCFYSKKETGIKFLEPKQLSDKLHAFLHLYFVALAFVAMEKSDKDYTISLCSKVTKSFTVSSKQAVEILNSLYEKMIDLKNIKYMDIEYIEKIHSKPSLDSVPLSIEKIEKDIENHTSWLYFSDRKMLNPDTDFGYSTDPLQQEMKDTYDEIAKNLLFL